MAMEQRHGMQLMRSEMTDVMQNADVTQAPQSAQLEQGGQFEQGEEGDIPIEDITGEAAAGGQVFPMIQSFPLVLPENPIFRVPANPLLPEGHNELLDYNTLQYMNGIFRTQIGRFVRVSQLVGSNTLEDYAGFLIGVGVNYIILQEYSGDNIRILDIYGIKSMYVYYTELMNPYQAQSEN